MVWKEHEEHQWQETEEMEDEALLVVEGEEEKNWRRGERKARSWEKRKRKEIELRWMEELVKEEAAEERERVREEEEEEVNEMRDIKNKTIEKGRWQAFGVLLDELGQRH